ncbi:hypothetical protein [Sporosarcina sp. E16_8]|uniref:hypothetical protein n=1 Tax=Sporosarcina sp. E16_8 TaxID=2789295 RepID=UPI001A90FD39|nr:hypothetical protein [Sporosarcina sp. E16_8]MBO0587732.1 hypothetical protein [Sporosarcina sp. E16_8]
MSILLVLGSLLIVIFLLNKQAFIQMPSTNTLLVQKLSNARWFKNEWLSGIFLFFINALLFSVAVSLFFLLGVLNIPFLHLVIMLLATFVSIYLWIAIHNAGNKGKRERLIMSTIGSSFYLFLLLTFIYMIANLGPGTPENDTFMAFIGLLFALFVSFVALVTCFCITGLKKKQYRI